MLLGITMASTKKADEAVDAGVVDITSRTDLFPSMVDQHHRQDTQRAISDNHWHTRSLIDSNVVMLFRLFRLTHF